MLHFGQETTEPAAAEDFIFWPHGHLKKSASGCFETSEEGFGARGVAAFWEGGVGLAVGLFGLAGGFPAAGELGLDGSDGTRSFCWHFGQVTVRPAADASTRMLVPHGHLITTFIDRLPLNQIPVRIGMRQIAERKPTRILINSPSSVTGVYHACNQLFWRMQDDCAAYFN